MNERIERLDRSMDFVLLFITVLSSALFQFIAALPYDTTNQSQVNIHGHFMRFSLNLFFLPLFFIIPMWLVIHILRNDERRMVLRAFVWSFTTMVMALDAIALVVFVIPFDLAHLIYSIIITIATVASVFFLGEFFLVYILKEYGKVLLTDPNVPTRFFQKTWQYTILLAPIASSLLFFIVLLVSLVV